jgi:hypothetical protein
MTRRDIPKGTIVSVREKGKNKYRFHVKITSCGKDVFYGFYSYRYPTMSRQIMMGMFYWSEIVSFRILKTKELIPLKCD